MLRAHVDNIVYEAYYLVLTFALKFLARVNWTCRLENGTIKRYHAPGKDMTPNTPVSIRTRAV